MSMNGLHLYSVSQTHRLALSTLFSTVCAVPWLQVDVSVLRRKGQPYPFHPIPSFEPDHGGVVLLLDGAEDAGARTAERRREEPRFRRRLQPWTLRNKPPILHVSNSSSIQ